MHKRLLVMLCWLLTYSLAFAQDDTQSVVVPVNEFFLKISPLSALETDGGIGFSGEYILVKPKLGLQLEIQPILFSIYKNDDYEEPSNLLKSGAPLGLKLRPELRYYLDGLRSKKYHRKNTFQADGTPIPHKNETRVYTAIDFLYKYVWRQRLGNLNINNGGTMPGYMQRAVYTDVKRITGFDIKMGFISSISKSNNWLLEGFAGIGFRHKKFHYKNLPVGTSEPERGGPVRLFSEGSVMRNVTDKRNAFSLPIGIKLVHRL